MARTPELLCAASCSERVNMFSLSKVTIYIFEAMKKYNNFMISSSIYTFQNNAQTIGSIHVIILQTILLNVQITYIYSI